MVDIFLKSFLKAIQSTGKRQVDRKNSVNICRYNLGYSLLLLELVVSQRVSYYLSLLGKVNLTFVNKEVLTN